MQSVDGSSNKIYKQNSFLESQTDSNFFGPVLPPHLLKKNFLEGRSESDCRPALSQQSHVKEKVLKQRVDAFIGPEIQHCVKRSHHSSSEIEEKEKEEEEETSHVDVEDDFGPPTTLMAEGDITTYKFNSGLNRNKETSENATNSSLKREAWMTELPKKKGANFGLLARHFKFRSRTDKESDNSVWTDTPEEKTRKQFQKKKNDYKEILQMERLKERDKEMEKLVKKAAKKLKKKQSLLEMHQKKIKKNEKIEIKKREKEKKILPERRPFDRNVDLRICKFDENQKRTILNKSQFLNNRFAPGQSKFL